MNIKFQTIDTAYRTPVTAQRRRAPQSGKAKGNYDTVTINGPRTDQAAEDSFARILAKSAASQVTRSASPERVQELSRQVADGTYQPDSSKIAGRLLGLS